MVFPAVEEAKPRDAPWRAFDPACDGGKRGAHEQRRREQTDRGNDPAQHDPDYAGLKI